MTIVDKHTLTHYWPLEFAVRLDDDNRISLHSTLAVFNADGVEMDRDHPTPQATQAQLDAFKAWALSNLQLYENATGLDRYRPPPPEEE